MQSERGHEGNSIKCLYVIRAKGCIREVVIEVKILNIHTSCCRREGLRRNMVMEAVVLSVFMSCRQSSGLC